MLENAEIKISKLKTMIHTFLTQIFLVNMTLEKPPTTLGENQFESFSFIFLNIAFYSETGKTQKIPANLQTYLDFRACTLPRKLCQICNNRKQKFTAP